jgi:hypothetical protein
MEAGIMKGRGGMRKRRGKRDADSRGALIRAWRWLRSSGYYEDDQAKPGPAQEAQAKDRFERATGTQYIFWKLNR